MDITVSYMIGRAANGAERGSGRRYHARVRGSYAAACGATPRPRSAGWSTIPAGAVTCPRCTSALIRAGFTLGDR